MFPDGGPLCLQSKQVQVFQGRAIFYIEIDVASLWHRCGQALRCLRWIPLDPWDPGDALDPLELRKFLVRKSNEIKLKI